MPEKVFIKPGRLVHLSTEHFTNKMTFIIHYHSIGDALSTDSLFELPDIDELLSTIIDLHVRREP